MSADELAREVSGSAGNVHTLEYVNTLRRITGAPELSRADYDRGVARCDELGCQEVSAMHIADFWAKANPPAP